MEQTFDINVNSEGVSSFYRVMLKEDYAELGACYLIYDGDRDIGYICRLPNGQYKKIDFNALTEDDINAIGRCIDEHRQIAYLNDAYKDHSYAASA